MADRPTVADRAPLADRALARARPRRAAVRDPPLLRHPRDDGRRHQPRGGRARLRHAAGDRRGRRREPARGPDPLHQQLRDARAAPGAVAPPRAALRRPLRPGHRAPDHGRRVGGGRPRPARDLRPGRRGHPPRAVVRRLRPGDRLRRRRRAVTSRPASRTTSRSTRRRSRPPSRRGPRRSSSATRATRPAPSCRDEVQDALAEIAVRHDLLVYSDEIYDRLAYGTYRHRAMSALPGMRERTILMGGFSKAYAMTGWRVGYVAAPAGDPRGDGQGPPVRDHVGADDRPGRGAGRRRRGRGRRRADARRVRPPPPAAGRRAQRAGARDVRAARRVLRVPADQLDRADDDEFTERLLTEERVAVVPGERVRAVGRRARADVLRDLVRAARGGAAPDRPVRGARQGGAARRPDRLGSDGSSRQARGTPPERTSRADLTECRRGRGGSPADRERCGGWVRRVSRAHRRSRAGSRRRCRAATSRCP